MANTVTELAKIPVIVRAGQHKGLIIPKVCSFDTASADITIHDTPANKYTGVCGMIYQDGATLTATFKSGSQTLFALENAANLIATFKGIQWPPIFCTRLGEDLIVNFTTAAITSMLIYVMEFDRLFFGD